MTGAQKTRRRHRQEEPQRRGERDFLPVTSDAPLLSGAKVILPEQFFRPGAESFAALTGERRLLFAVLEEALHTFFRYRNDRSRRGQRLFNEVSAWFWSEDQQWLYGFESICQHLNFDADYIRGGLRRLAEKKRKGSQSPLPASSIDVIRRSPGQLPRAA